MENTLSKKAIQLSKEAAFILLTVIGAVVLPQIFHVVGVQLGIGGKLGQIFLPMYLPILIIGFYRGPVSGAIAGLIAPMISFMLTKMPSSELLPFITLELIATGALAGAFAKWKKPVVLRIFLVQVLAKLVRLTAFAISLFSVNGTVNMSVLFSGILTSIPGVVLQLVLLTVLIVRKEKRNV